MPFTVVSFHAHPDDEALLTSGTLARAAAEGHRVVLVVATSGGAGLAAGEHGRGDELARRREAELRASAAALGCARVELLGYRDSGLGQPEPGEEERPAAGSVPFAGLDPAEPAARLAEILAAEHADVVTGYDPAGGYGHRDHVQVHRVARLAARQAGTPVLLEATVDRDALARAARVASRLPRLGGLAGPDGFGTAYTPRELITHVVDVRRHAAAKRASMRSHVSQRGGDPSGLRTLEVLSRLPEPLFRRALGREWFTELGRTPGRPPLDDIFASLR